ncbi:collectin-12-like [Ylistrum balloti]|uniref:collectin-12-like n=1 Tax=Ylistrum balloti TaxID=509963 RepID=UPI002905A38C|nr:collectin-12-like [Ylistrum balloti]
MVQYCSGDNDTDVVRFLDTLTDRTGAKAYRLASKCDSAGYTLNRMTGQCLKVVLTTKSYVDAKQYCEDEGGVLAKLESTERMIGAINITLIYSDKNGYLVGATDIASEGVWTWQDGTPVEGIDVLFNNYDAKYEPGRPADCGSLYKSVRIGDNRCFEKRQFICERRDLEPL